MSQDHDADYTVGYGKPPRHSQFKKGQSGNPRGRRAQPKTFDALLETALNQPVSVTLGARKVRVSKREAIVMTMVNGALKGNIRHLEFLARLMRESSAIEPFEVRPEDEAILKALAGPAPEPAQEYTDADTSGSDADAEEGSDDLR